MCLFLCVYFCFFVAILRSNFFHKNEASKSTESNMVYSCCFALFEVLCLFWTKIRNELKLVGYISMRIIAIHMPVLMVDQETIRNMFESIEFFDLVEKLNLSALRAIWFFVSVGHSHETSQTQSMKKVWLNPE